MSATAIQSWIDDGLMLYVNRKNISRSFPAARLQLPGARNKTANMKILDEKDFSSEQLGMIVDPDADVNTQNARRIDS